MVKSNDVNYAMGCLELVKEQQNVYYQEKLIRQAIEILKTIVEKSEAETDLILKGLK